MDLKPSFLIGHTEVRHSSSFIIHSCYQSDHHLGNDLRGITIGGYIPYAPPLDISTFGCTVYMLLAVLMVS